MSATPATVQSALGGLYDQLIDPVTLDYVRTANGEWLETADSRSLVLIMLETELNGSPFTPSDGTRFKALAREDAPITPEVILADSLRAASILVRDGVIADVSGEVRDGAGDVYRDESGRPVCVLHWRDLAAGSPIDLVFRVGS